MLPISTIGRALAHDHQHPELNGWYESLRSAKGPCCDGTDAERVDDADWETKDGHYRVRIDGEWVDVPNEAVVAGPNLAGRTMVWPYLPKWSSEGALLHAGKHGLIVSARRVRSLHKPSCADCDDIRELSLSMRKAALVRLLARRIDGIFLSDFEQGEIGPDLFRHVCLMGPGGPPFPSTSAPTEAAGATTGSRSRTGGTRHTAASRTSSR